MNLNKASVSVGDIVMVRLARLPGMSDKDPTDDELAQMRLARTDPVVMHKLLEERRAAHSKKDDPVFATLSAKAMNAEFHLHPRRREARVDYVERTSGAPSQPYGELTPSVIGTVNVEVHTLGSTVLQPAVGHYPDWAMERFRLAGVQWFDEEPDDVQDQHVAYPIPVPEGK